jgi:hypothetical protein
MAFVLLLLLGAASAPATSDPRQAAHDGSNGDAENVGGFLVGNAFDANHGHKNLLLGRQAGDAVRHGSKSETAFGDVAAIHADQVLDLVKLTLIALNLAAAVVIDPDVLRNTIHPTIETRSGLPLIQVREGSLARVLYEVISLVFVAGQREGEPAQTRQ